MFDKLKNIDIYYKLTFHSDKVKKSIEWIAVIISIVAGIFGIIQFISTQEIKNEEELEGLILSAANNHKNIIYIKSLNIKEEVDKLTNSNSVNHDKLKDLLVEIIEELKNVNDSIIYDKSERFLATQQRLQTIISRKNDLELKLHTVIEQQNSWSTISKKLKKLATRNRSKNTQKYAKLEEDLAKVNQIEKLLEMEANRIDKHRVSAVTEIQAIKRVVTHNTTQDLSK